MREHVDRVKNWKQFLNENKTEQYDSFIINVKYEVGYSDIDTKNILPFSFAFTFICPLTTTQFDTDCMLAGLS